MIPIEQYAELCALMADTAGDVNKENAIAAAHGVSPDAWHAAKTGYTAKMSDPNDMGRTAINVLGNCLASVIVAKWEGVFGTEAASPIVLEGVAE